MSVERLGQVDELEAEAEVGLVRAVAVAGLGPRHALNRRRALPRRRLGGVEHGGGDVGHDVVLGGEGALHIELHELELAVGPEVLVAQAAGDLEVAVEAAHHEELLGQLRALRERVELAVVEPRRDRELPRPLGGGRPQQRRLDFGEALAVHGRREGGVDPGPEAQVALHARPPEVDVAVLQPDGLVGLVAVVDGERRRLGLVEDLDGAVADLDLARADAGVDGAFGPGADGAGDGDDPLGAHVGGVVDDALNDAGVVPQVHEGEMLAVLPAPGHPAADGHGLAHVGRAQDAAEVGAQRRGPVLASGRSVVGRFSGAGGSGPHSWRFGAVGSFGGRWAGQSAVVSRSRSQPAGLPRQEGDELLHNGSPGHAALLGVAAQRPQADGPRLELLRARRPGPPGRPSGPPT